MLAYLRVRAMLNIAGIFTFKSVILKIKKKIDDDKALKNKMETEEKQLEKMVEDLKKEHYNQCHFLEVSLCILVDDYDHSMKNL